MLKRANVSLTVKQIANMYETNGLTFDNAVQRGLVWDNKRKSLLIHSLIMGYPVPPLYAAKADDGYDVLDGKQRCNALYEFMHDMFELTDVPEVYVVNEDGETEEIDINTLKFSEMEEQLQDAVKDYQIAMHYFEGITPDEVSEMFFRLNNGKAMSAIELTRCKAKSMSMIKEIGTHELFKNALTEKALARYTNEDIVVKSYILLHEKEPSLETKFIRPYMESVEITEEDRDELNKVYTRILNVHGLIEDKKIAKRLLTRTHLISIIPIVQNSIEMGISEKDFAEWFCTFFAGKKSATISQTYNDCAGSGSAKKENVRKRTLAIFQHWGSFFAAKANAKKEEVTETTDNDTEEVSVNTEPDVDATDVKTEAAEQMELENAV